MSSKLFVFVVLVLSFVLVGCKSPNIDRARQVVDVQEAVVNEVERLSTQIDSLIQEVEENKIPAEEAFKNINLLLPEDWQNELTKIFNRAGDAYTGILAAKAATDRELIHQRERLEASRAELDRLEQLATDGPSATNFLIGTEALLGVLGLGGIAAVIRAVRESTSHNETIRGIQQAKTRLTTEDWASLKESLSSAQSNYTKVKVAKRKAKNASL